MAAAGAARTSRRTKKLSTSDWPGVVAPDHDSAAFEQDSFSCHSENAYLQHSFDAVDFRLHATDAHIGARGGVPIAPGGAYPGNDGRSCDRRACFRSGIVIIVVIDTAAEELDFFCCCQPFGCCGPLCSRSSRSQTDLYRRRSFIRRSYIVMPVKLPALLPVKRRDHTRTKKTSLTQVAFLEPS